MRLSTLLNPLGKVREAQLSHPLRAVPLFTHLSADDLNAIWRRIERRPAAAGAVVCRRGEPGDAFYVVQSGALEGRLGPAERSILVRRLGPGDPFGEMALLTGAPRSADVVATEESVLWCLDRQQFEEVTTQSIPLLRALNRDLAARIGDLTLQFEEQGLEHASPHPAGRRFGQFRTVAQIGAGGTAVVFSAVHCETEEAAALKVFPAAWVSSPVHRARFGREIEALRAIRHPNVVRVLDAGGLEEDSGQQQGCYLAMEWLPHALDHVLRAQYPDPLPPERALAVAGGVAEGLAVVHAAGLVHRDVKPANVLLRADGTPVLADFGLVRTADVHALRLTAENVIMGSADYIAPEHMTGSPADARADLYSLGVVLYELLCGHVPYAGRTPYETLRAHVEEPPPPLPMGIPAAARAVVERALRKDPAERFISAAGMANALGAARVTLGTDHAGGRPLQARRS